MKRLLCIIILLATPLWAVEPGEILDDPVLEARARSISADLRCPVCQNESIDESHAPIAKELRVLVRERLVAGDSDDEIKAFLVARFGEFVLLAPQRNGANLILWFAAPVMLLLALGAGWFAIRQRPDSGDGALTDAEQEALDKILRS